jgi:hypothetical protein
MLRKPKIQFDETKYGLQWTSMNQNAIHPTRLSANFFVSPVQKQPCLGLGRLTVEVFRSHTVRCVILSVGLIWMRDRPFTLSRRPPPEQRATFTRYRRPCLRQDSNLQSQIASGHQIQPQRRRINTKRNQNLLRSLADEACRQICEQLKQSL